MSATFFVSQEVTWMPQSWIYNGLLHRLVPELADVAPHMAHSIQKYLDVAYEYDFVPVPPPDEENGREHIEGYFSNAFAGGLGTIEKLEEVPFNTFLKATERVMTVILRHGPVDFEEPREYLGLPVDISELEALLRLDRRARDHKSDPARVIFQNEIAWTAPRWAYDLALAKVIAWLQSHNSTAAFLLERLLACRELTSEGECDLKDIPAEEFAELVPAVEWLLKRHVEAMVSAAVAPGFLEALADHIRDLAGAVKADPRSTLPG